MLDVLEFDMPEGDEEDIFNAATADYSSVALNDLGDGILDMINNMTAQLSAVGTSVAAVAAAYIRTLTPKGKVVGISLIKTAAQAKDYAAAGHKVCKAKLTSDLSYQSPAAFGWYAAAMTLYSQAYDAITLSSSVALLKRADLAANNGKAALTGGTIVKPGTTPPKQPSTKPPVATKPPSTSPPTGKQPSTPLPPLPLPDTDTDTEPKQSGIPMWAIAIGVVGMGALALWSANRGGQKKPASEHMALRGLGRAKRRRRSLAGCGCQR